MSPTQIADLEAEFRRRGKVDPAADSVWRLASALLIDAASKAQPSPLLTAPELATALSLKGEGWQTIHRWKRAGKIPAAIDEPNCCRFDLAEVRAALAARAARATSDDFKPRLPMDLGRVNG